MMKQLWLVPATLALLQGCGGIGDGNAPESLEILIGGNNEDPEVFVCASQVPQAVLTFSNGTAGDFVNRVTWTSSNPDILTVSDGTVEAPQGVFVNGALLPKAPGTVTLRADYLEQFSDEIEVTVSATQLELGPVRSDVLVNRGLSITDTIVSKGQSRFFSSDFNRVGIFSIDGVDPDSESPPITIDPVTGLTTVTEAGEYTLRYAVDFCGQEATATLIGVDTRLNELRISRRGESEAISSLDLLPDSSTDITVTGIFADGSERDVTTVVRFAFENDAGEAVEDIAFATLRGIGTISAFAKPATPEGETPVEFPRVVTLKVSFDPTPLDASAEEEGDEVFAPDLTLRVLDSELVRDSLRVSPINPTILPGTGVGLRVEGDFTGPAGDFSAVDLTKDVQWLSGDLNRVSINNTIGSKGFAFAARTRFDLVDDVATQVTNLGDASATARRFSQADEDGAFPEAATTISVGRPDPAEGEEALAAVRAANLQLSLRDPAASRAQFDQFSVQALADLVRDDVVVTQQDLSGQVIWELVAGNGFASISNASGRKGVITVLSDQQVDITVRASYRDTRVQSDTIIGDLVVSLNTGG